MRTLTEQARLVHQKELAKNEAFRNGNMDECLKLHQDVKDLHALPVDHELRQYECPFHGKFSEDPLVLTYLCLYDLDREGNGDYHLRTDYHGAHSIAFCPKCREVILAYHKKR